jgi:hypothetical protein
MIVTWVDVPNTDGLYAVSSDGKVRSNRQGKTKPLQAWTHTTGYKRVALGRNNCRYVHRLVAVCFLPNPDNLPTVDHIDGDKNNNAASNLRWVTSRQNAIYGAERHNWEAQRVASAKRRIHAAKKQEYEALFSQGYSLRHIARLFGTSHSTVSNAIKNY